MLKKLKELKKLKGLLSLAVCISVLCAAMPMTAHAETDSVGNAADETYTANFAAKQETVSKLFSTTSADSLMTRAVDSGFVTDREEILGVSFVDLSDYDLTGKTTADYSADQDGSVLAWFDSASSVLYIGGYGKIVAGSSLSGAFYYGTNINAITGMELLDTSNTTDMSEMFVRCGEDSKTFTLDLGNNFDTSSVINMQNMFSLCGDSSTVFQLNLGNKFDTSSVTNMHAMFSRCGFSSTSFTLDLGDKFDTSNVTRMGHMFSDCGYSSKVFTLDLGDKFNTEKVTDMSYMFYGTGEKGTAFTELDLSGFTISEGMRAFSLFAASTPVTTFIFGEGWANAVLPSKGFAKRDSNTPTTVIGATKNLLSYDWTQDNRTVTFPGREYYTITALAGDGGTVSGGGQKVEGASVTLTATANDGYAFEGWYDGNEKVCDTAKFVIDTVTGAKTYTAKFTKIVYYTITAEAGTVGGTVTGGGKTAKGESVTLTATADDGYIFDGWYDGDTKVCDTAEFTVENVTADKTYTAKFTKIVYYTITAEVGTDGGTVSGGGRTEKGGSVTLTATADDGYTFDGWYDGDTKVCGTEVFVVENVTADKTYTAKFTKDVIEPDIPYLDWDGSTLTLVKKQGASCRVGIVYIGGATMDADNISWEELVAAGKEYVGLNSAAGYAVYNNFTKRTPGTRGNYVAFVKYTKEDGTTTADYITYTVKDGVSFDVPALSYNRKTKTLNMKGNVKSTVGVAYVGDTQVNTSNITWNDFVKSGKKYADINGENGYSKVTGTLDYAETFETNGNYVAFIKYFDENLNKTLAKYYSFTVADYEQPTDAPFVTAAGNEITLSANGFDVAKVTIVYIGTEDKDITNWSAFSAAAAKFSDINGKDLNRQYTNPKDGSVWAQDTAGWYAVYVRYIENGKTCHTYYTAELG